MERVSVLQFRRQAETIIRKVQKGKPLLLTYRGKPVLRLEPIQEQQVSPDDRFYALSELAVSKGESLTNEEIDQIVYIQ